MIFLRLLCVTVRFTFTLGPDTVCNIFHINSYGLLPETYLFFTPFWKEEVEILENSVFAAGVCTVHMLNKITPFSCYYFLVDFSWCTMDRSVISEL
jgi:hypothetical protein